MDFDKIVIALEKIKPLKENRGIIKCPKCGSNLHYSRASYNGHVWGKCETKDCLSWMQ